MSVDGNFSFAATDSGERAGRYVICLWLAGSADDASATAHPQVALTVGRRTACVVPRLPRGRHLSAVERRIRASHCSVGRIRHTRRTRLRRGLVVRLSPRSGRHLRRGARVDVVLSRRR
jgi:hypothetical protein